MPVPARAIYDGMTMEEPNEQPEAGELEAQLEAASDAVRAAVLRLLKGGEVHPRVIVLAMAGVAGELGAAAALADDGDAGELLDVLADTLREAGLEHAKMLRVVTVPAAGSA